MIVVACSSCDKKLSTYETSYTLTYTGQSISLCRKIE